MPGVSPSPMAAIYSSLLPASTLNVAGTQVVQVDGSVSAELIPIHDNIPGAGPPTVTSVKPASYI